MAKNLKGIKSTLLNSGIQQKHPALYQVINQIIDFSQDSIDQLSSKITNLTPTSSGGGGGGGAPTSGDYLTSADDHVTLPNSRQLLPGIGITFDDTVTNKRTINGASSGDYVVASDGGSPPLPLDDGFGSFIYILYTP